MVLLRGLEMENNYKKKKKREREKERSNLEENHFWRRVHVFP